VSKDEQEYIQNELSIISSLVYYKINQQDARIFRVYYSTFICGSTCFGRHTAHHQENTTAPAASGFAYVVG
jgi:hypothetical protein